MRRPRIWAHSRDDRNERRAPTGAGSRAGERHPRAAEPRAPVRALSAGTLGVLAVLGLVVAFSLSSTLVKRAETPGVLVAFWRMIVVSVAWNVVLWCSGRRVTLRDVRQVWIPGVFFGLNLAVFFAGATHNSVANAALIGSCAPFLIVPVGAWLFSEYIHPRALLFAAVAFGGVALVLFSAPPGGDASLEGNVFGVIAMLLLVTYVAATKRFRQEMDVTTFMATICPIAAVAVLPIAIAHRRRVLDERDRLEVHADPQLYERDHGPGATRVRAEDDSDRDDRVYWPYSACTCARVGGQHERVAADAAPRGWCRRRAGRSRRRSRCPRR